MLPLEREPLLVFVPAEGADAAEYRECKRRFTQLGIRRFRQIPINKNWNAKKEQALLSADVIFLGGGNTYYFLKHLRDRGLVAKLKNFAKRGGILLGLSAGSILMTPSVGTAAVPSVDCDENDVGIKNKRAMGLVPFEFSPHYVKSKKSDAELKRYSRKITHPIYACADGEGLVVRNGKLNFVGRVSVFRGGKKLRAN
jgi:dipeptidase E